MMVKLHVQVYLEVRKWHQGCTISVWSQQLPIGILLSHCKVNIKVAVQYIRLLKRISSRSIFIFYLHAHYIYIYCNSTKGPVGRKWYFASMFVHHWFRARKSVRKVYAVRPFHGLLTFQPTRVGQPSVCCSQSSPLDHWPVKELILLKGFSWI